LLGEDQQMLAMRRRTVSGVEAVKKFPFYDLLGSKIYPSYLRCSLRDLDTGRLQVRSFTLPVQPAEGEALRLSSIVLTDPAQSKPLALYGSNDSENRMASNPFKFEQVTINPGFHQAFAQSPSMDVFFRVEGGAPGQREVFISVVKDRARAEAPMDAFSDEQRDEAGLYFCRLKLDQLQPGEYTLWVKAVDKANGTSTMAAKSFRVGFQG